MTESRPQPDRPCPSDAELSAFVDGRLPGEDRALLEVHLAQCTTCLRLIAEVTRLQSTWDEERRPLRFGLTTRLPNPVRRWAPAAGVAAIAASLLVFVATQTNLLRRSQTPHQALVAAVGSYRTVEGKLADVSYGALRSATRSASPDLPGSFERAAVMAQVSSLEREPATSATLHAMGVGRLVLGEHDEAVRALEGAAQQDPRNPRVLNDLSAAYHARAVTTGSKEDLTRALRAADDALAVDARFADAYFNRALVLESLLLPGAAQQAWRQFVALEPDGDWVVEARSHLTAADAAEPGPVGQPR